MHVGQRKASFNAFTAGHPFLGKLLGVSVGKGFRALKGCKRERH